MQRRVLSVLQRCTAARRHASPCMQAAGRLIAHEPTCTSNGIYAVNAASQSRSQVFARGFAVSGITQTSPTQLDQVMDISKLVDKTPEEVAHVWLEGHSDPSKGRVGAVMSAAEYDLLKERGKKCPMFVLPLKKGEGSFVTLVIQMQLPFILITTLDEFRRLGPGAPPSLALIHYTELIDSKHVVLVRGDLVNDKLISGQEARAIFELTRAFYTNDEDYQMVQDFNFRQAHFDFNALLVKLGQKPLEA